MELKHGSQLQGGRYRIEKVLGQGGFGITYLGVQTSLDDKVAIKEFFMKDLCNRDTDTFHVSVGSVGSRELVDGFRRKFIKEARNIRKLKHGNIVSIIDVFEENGTAYYVMEYLDGGNLKDFVEKNGALDEAVAVAYVGQLASALEKVHSNGLLHLDIKPANVMLNESGEAVLIDFGISKHYDEGGAQTSSGLVGTSEGYAPLEQYEAASLKTFTPATDVYALGATLYFLLTGTRPPKASEVMNSGLPELPANLSQKVRRAIETAMQPAVRMRPQSVKEFMEALSRVGDGVVSGSVETANTDRTKFVAGGDTVIEESVVAEQKQERIELKTHGTDKEQKVKWMDFAQFCDYNGCSLKMMNAANCLKPLAYVVWSITLLFMTICLICYMEGDKSYLPFWGRMEVVEYGVYSIYYNTVESVDAYHPHAPGPVTWIFFGLSVLFMAVLIPIKVKGGWRLNTLNLIDIQDTSLSLKMIRNKKGLLGLSLWNKKKSRTLLGMKYDNISRVNDDTFICTRNGLHGVYNATKRKMFVPVKCESIEVKDNRIHATCDGVVTVYTDHGYRVVE